MDDSKGTVRPADAGPLERGVRPPLVLTAKTNKGKNRLREIAERVPAWTGRWEVTAETRFVSFAPGVAGPWFLVKPEGASRQDSDVHARWVHEYFDENFNVAAA